MVSGELNGNREVTVTMRTQTSERSFERTEGNDNDDDWQALSASFSIFAIICVYASCIPCSFELISRSLTETRNRFISNSNFIIEPSDSVLCLFMVESVDFQKTNLLSKRRRVDRRKIVAPYGKCRNNDKRNEYKDNVVNTTCSRQ